MGGAAHRATTSNRVPARTPPKRIHTTVIPAPTVISAPFRHSCAPFPSFLRRQELTHPNTHPPSPIHPSPLPGGRLGGGCDAPNAHHRPSARPRPSKAHPHLHRTRAHRHTRPFRHSCAPSRHSCAGRNPPAPTPTPLPQFIPPPFQGGGEVGGAAHRATTTARVPARAPPKRIRTSIAPTPKRGSVAGKARGMARPLEAEGLLCRQTTIPTNIIRERIARSAPSCWPRGAASGWAAARAIVRPTPRP